MSFFKITSLASVSTAISMLGGLLTTKVVAQIVGPEGMAFAGQFTNITLLLSMFATGACTMGITKYVAEYEGEKRKQLLATAFCFVSFCTIIISIGAFFFASLLSNNAFNTTEITNVFRMWAVLQAFSSTNAVVGAILIGLQRIKEQTIVAIVTAILNVIFIIVLANLYGIKGALIGTSVTAVFSFFINIYYIKKTGLLPSLHEWRPLYSFPQLKTLLNFSVMALVSGLLVPSIQLFIRSKLLTFSTFNAGIWQATTRVSDYYLNFIYAVLGIYYLPKLSQLQGDDSAFKKEIRLGFARIIPVVSLLSLTIWLCRSLIINWLLTREFEPMLELLKYQLIFDVIKIASWLVGYIMWAKALRNRFIITEVVFSIVFVIVSDIMIDHYGTIGAVYAFGLNYTMYLLSLLVLFRKTIF